MYKLIEWVAVLSFVLVQVVGQCTNPVQRKEFGSLSPNERNRFLNAIRRLHQKRSASSVSRYDQYAVTHMDFNREAHGQPQFLPWHRQYIRNLEKDLQSIDSGVVLPYWDWSKDSSSPEESYIFGKSYMGGNGRGRDACVRDGPFAGWQMSTPNTHCLARDFDGGDYLSPFVSGRVIDRLLDIEDFSDFAERLEVAHGTIHNNIGGGRGDMLPMWSPNDPIFFMHHVFVDMLWWNWQRRNARSSQYGGDRNGRSVRTSDVMRPFGVSVASVIRTNSREHCYTYPTYRPSSSRGSSRVNSAGSGASGRSLLGILPVGGSSSASDLNAKPLSSSFIAMSGMEESRVRKIEEEFREMNE